MPSNHLSEQTSPYLLQHAGNPVDWYPWCNEALELARKTNKPILLSIGYSACHWCHVMAHESFEDDKTAELMNELFINIKVDREERPDLDKIYQTAHQIMTQRPGGWPLTVFLTPGEQMPFFAGTYFPNTPRHGMPSFMDVLSQVNQWFHNNPEQLSKNNHQLQQIFRQINRPETDDVSLDSSILQQARQELQSGFDQRLGGFGKAPKFPHPTSLERLLRHWYTNGSTDHIALQMVTFTLQQMALGGIYDQLGGGFCRYSVDDQWMIPHFEKMLYDNGPLLGLYAQAWAATANPLFKKTCIETAEWVMREMQSPEGGYYSTLDADSEGEEGKFYVWTPDEVRQLVDENEYTAFSQRFGLDRSANFEGHWHLHTYTSINDIAKSLKTDEATINNLLDSAQEKLFKVREQRIHPGRDEKVLTAWNGLMIKGMVIASRHLENEEWIDSAQRALDFIRQTLWINNRLLATYKDGKAHLNAYLDDHAFLLDAVLEFLQVRWNSDYLTFAVELADTMINHFEDKVNGGFFFTSDDHEQLIQRPMPFSDDAIPSGNGIAAYALQRLGYLTGNTAYLEAADNTLKAAASSIIQYPFNHTALLLSFEESQSPVEIIILRGKEEELAEWRLACISPYAPSRMAFTIPETETNLPESISEKTCQADTTAYICRGTTCSTPIVNIEELRKIIEPGL
ncbi:MAG: thioredoxin domain-containing protein [Gammaproteobacteria bacterium]|nr:MAG: thioredoxin domain-containing protein [Gammaproteobacteria bacterium]